MGAADLYDCIVIGAGAAGLMCAFEAGRRGRRVLVLEHGPKAGRKILISGGGRCNFTNLGTRAENFLSENPHFAKSALARYTPGEFVALVERHGVRYHEKTLGQLFCNDSAQRIVTLLERECAEARVEVRLNTAVLAVQAADGAGMRFAVQTPRGGLRCAALVVATGGLSIPKLGATGFGYDVARQFGHAVVEPRAALVPLLFSAEDRERWCDLTGLSTEVVAAVAPEETGRGRGRSAAPPFREKLLITHRGVSGPAVLQISSYWRPGRVLRMDLAPERGDVLAPLRAPKARRDRAAVLTAVKAVLPSRLAERWVDAQGELDFSDLGLGRLDAALHGWAMLPAGTEGFAKAEVTAGGVDTRELDSHTLMSRRQPGLYFAGEVVDVTGWLGGYNFQWAWASGASVGRAV